MRIYITHATTLSLFLSLPHLVQQRWVRPPLEQGLGDFGVAVLAGEVQRREACLVDAVHETERSEQDLDNVVIAIPSSFVEGRVAKL